MERLFKFTATLAFCLVTSSAMAVDGINSTGNNPLPIGAGGEPIIILNPNGMMQFLRPSTGAETAWINANTGEASFAYFSKLTVKSPVGNKGALGTVNVNGNQVWTNSGNLHLNWATAGDSVVYVGGPNKKTGVFLPQGSIEVAQGVVKIGSEEIDEDTAKIANTLKNCQVGETVVKTATGYGCAEQAVVPKGTTCGGWGNNTMSMIGINDNFPHPFPCDNLPLGQCPKGWSPKLTLSRGMGNKSWPLDMNTCVKD